MDFCFEGTFSLSSSSLLRSNEYYRFSFLIRTGLVVVFPFFCRLRVGPSLCIQVFSTIVRLLTRITKCLHIVKYPGYKSDLVSFSMDSSCTLPKFVVFLLSAVQFPLFCNCYIFYWTAVSACVGQCLQSTANSIRKQQRQSLKT